MHPTVSEASGFACPEKIVVSEQLQRYCEGVRPCPRCHRRRHLKEHRLDWFHVTRRIARIEKEFLYLPYGDEYPLRIALLLPG